MASSSASAALLVNSSTPVPLLVVADSPKRPLLLAVPKDTLVEVRADTALLMFTLLRCQELPVVGKDRDGFGVDQGG